MEEKLLEERRKTLLTETKEMKQLAKLQKFLLYFGIQLDIMCYIEDYEILEYIQKLKEKQQKKQVEKPLVQVIVQ